MTGVRARVATAIASVGVILTLGWLPACASMDCSLVGANGGFEVTVDLRATVRAEATSIQTCVQNRCRTRALFPADVEPAIQVDNEDVISGEDIAVSVELLDQSGERLAGGTTNVKPTVLQPNGPGCDPTVWRARVTATSTGLMPTT